jgi:phage recombination protein Bet
MENKILPIPQQNAISTQVRYTEEQIKTIKNTVAKGSTDDELKMFIGIAEKYGLDPFIKEIWFIKRAKKIKDNKGNWDYPRLEDGSIDYTGAETIIMTSRDGYLKIAQRDSDFDGIIGFPVKEGDIFEIDAENYTVIHKFGAKRGKIIGAWAKVSHKHRKPVIVWADYTEYSSGNSTIWKQYPSAMIQKVAEVLALKRQFGISGLTTKEEMSTSYDEYEASQVIEIKQEDVEKPSVKSDLEVKQPVVHMMEKEQKANIWDIAQAKGMTIDQLKQFTMKNIQTPLTNLTYEQANDLLEIISKYLPEEVPIVEAEQVVLQEGLTQEEQETLNAFAAAVED